MKIFALLALCAVPALGQTTKGKTEVTWYGDWDRSPVSPASPELIAVAR